MRTIRALLMLLMLVVTGSIVAADPQIQPFRGELCATAQHDCRPRCRTAEIPELFGTVWHHEECRNAEGDITQRSIHRHTDDCCWL